MIRRRLILGFYGFCKAIGLFHMARRLTKSELRILCYHGFVLDDEDRFRRSLFVTRAFFEDRVRYLHDNGYPILHLEEALDRLHAGTLSPCSVAVTIDEGFHSVFAGVLEVLRDHRVPATLYLTSYYFQKGTPIFELAVAFHVLISQ